MFYRIWPSLLYLASGHIFPCLLAYRHQTIELFMGLLLSHLSRVRLCVTPYTAAHQAPPSLGFSRQEHWSGLPFPSPMHKSEKWKWSHSVVTPSDPMNCSPPGSSVHGIFQARVLEWGAIAFSVYGSRKYYTFLFFYLWLKCSPLLILILPWTLLCLK